MLISPKGVIFTFVEIVNTGLFMKQDEGNVFSLASVSERPMGLRLATDARNFQAKTHFPET